MYGFTTSALWAMPVLAVLLGSAASSPVSRAGGADLTGIWILNVERSSWGRMKVPASVIVEIEQEGNAIRYTGWVTYANEDTREFSFDGAIDGDEYPVTRSYGPGKLALRQTDDLTIRTLYTSLDGRYVENVRMVLSPNHRRMTRYMSLKSPVGSRQWIEVYERRD